jgi:hypothetical protein
MAGITQKTEGKFSKDKQHEHRVFSLAENLFMGPLQYVLSVLKQKSLCGT